MLWKALIYVLEKQMFPEFFAKNMCISVQLLHLSKHIPSYEGFTTSAYHFFSTNHHHNLDGHPPFLPSSASPSPYHLDTVLHFQLTTFPRHFKDMQLNHSFSFINNPQIWKRHTLRLALFGTCILLPITPRSKKGSYQHHLLDS